MGTYMRLVGIGVDIEGMRVIRKEMTRFFLTEKEQESLPSEWLRLWTVKESLFKACPNNEDLLLSDFETDNPCAMAGKARLNRDPSLSFQYTCHRMKTSFVTFAVCEKVEE